MDLEEVIQDRDLSDGWIGERCAGGSRIYENGGLFGQKL